MSKNEQGRPSERPGMGRPAGFGPGIAMAMPVEKARDAKATLRRLLGYFGPHWLPLSMVFVAAVLSTIFSIWSPKILGHITTDLFDGMMARLHHVPGGGVHFLVISHLLILLSAVYVVSAIFSYVEQYLMAGVAQKTVYGLRRQVMDKMTRLPVSYFDSRPHGEILSRFVNDFDNISSTLQQSLTQAVTSIVTFLGVIVMMLTISWLMTLVVALTLPLSFVVTRTVAKKAQAHFLKRQRQLGEINGHIEEMYTGHAIVKAFNREERSQATFDEINERLYESSWKAQFVTGIIFPLMNFIGNLGYVLVSVIGGILVTQGSIQIGDIQAFIQYARQFSQPITQLASISNTIQSALASSERIFELLDEPEESKDMTTTDRSETPRGDVAFEAVSFGYQPERPVITDLSLDVQSGQTVAIVGPTGSGKTTLVNLLMRFYDVEAGHIRIDGQDISRIPRPRLRAMFGMVLQDTWLFHGTIAQNIGYGRKGSRFDEIVEAAQAANADHFIRTLPEGYETILNEEGSNISQGQRQLLTIARAILADPLMLILDEATSSVDTRTEMHIQAAMQRLMKGRTSFVIAHRLSTIREASLILVMSHGRVVEQGTHEALLRAQGFYADLYQSQFTVGQTEREAVL